MKVSVIIVNYNGRDFIGECVDSVLASNYSDLEIVVVDNASTDGSFEYLKKGYGEDKRVKIVRSDKQLYFTGGSNLGAKTARGERLIFLNSDTVVDRNFIQELASFAKDRDKCLIQPKTLFYNQKNVIDNAGGRYAFLGFGSAIGRGEKDHGQYDKNTRVDYANGTCFMISRKFFEELDGFDEWYKYYYEDVDLNLRARKRGGESWYCYKSIIYHKGSLTFKSNVRNETLLFNIRKNRLRTLIKNFNGLEKIVRVSGLLLIYTLLTLRDLLTFRPQRMLLTFKAALATLSGPTLVSPKNNHAPAE